MSPLVDNVFPLPHRARANFLGESIAPELVRTALMKHLDILEDAGLIGGRARWNHLHEKSLTGMATWHKRRVLTPQGKLQRLKKLSESKATRYRN